MKKNIRTAILWVLILAAGLWLLNALFMPKYMSDIPEGALIAEYYKEETGHDVIFIGDCEVYENFSPDLLWREYGLTSYIRGSAQQLIWQSYYLMEETLNYETPKVMVFNVLSMKYGEPQSEAYNRLNLDGMRLSPQKIAAVLDAQRAGDRFILWTCRIGERLEEAVAWSAAQGLTFDAVNDNLPDMIALYGNNCRKVFADGYIDDRNVRDLLGVEP